MAWSGPENGLMVTHGNLKVCRYTEDVLRFHAIPVPHNKGSGNIFQHTCNNARAHAIFILTSQQLVLGVMWRQ